MKTATAAFLSLVFIITAPMSLLALAKEVTSMQELRAHLSSKQPVGILFYAPWCGACSAMKEPYNRVCELLKKDALLVRVNVEDEKLKEALEQFGIEAVPTLIVKHVGLMDQDQLQTAMRCFIKKATLKPKQPSPQKPAVKPAPKKAPVAKKPTAKSVKR